MSSNLQKQLQKVSVNILDYIKNSCSQTFVSFIFMKKDTENAFWDLVPFKLRTLYNGDLWNDCTLWTVPRAPTLLVSLLKEKLEGDGKQVEFLKEWVAKCQKKLFTLAHIPHIGLDSILHRLRTPNEAFFIEIPIFWGI